MAAPLVMLLGLRAMALMQRLELEGAAAEAEAAEDAARLQGEPHLLHFALWIRALVHDVRGEARRRRARRPRGLAPDRAGRAEQALAHRRVRLRGARRGPVAGDRRHPGRGREAVEHADPTWQPRLLLRLVRAAIAAGDLDDAERWAEQAAAFAERLKLPAGILRAATACAEVLLARGDAAGAAAVAEEAGALGDRAAALGGAPLDLLEARMVAGRRARPPRGDPRAPATSCSASRRTRRRAARHALTRRRGRELRKARLARLRAHPARRAARHDALRARAGDRHARQRGPLQQAGRRDAVPEREDDRERADDDLRQARRALTRRAEPPLPPRPSSGGRAGRGRRPSWRRGGRRRRPRRAPSSRLRRRRPG